MSDPSGRVSISRPSAGEAGRTGDWRSKRPVLVVAEKCSAVKLGTVSCQFCWVYCPEACVARGIGPVFDLEHCKGCGICAEMCPTGAIEMVDEALHGVCSTEEGSR